MHGASGSRAFLSQLSPKVEISVFIICESSHPSVPFVCVCCVCVVLLPPPSLVLVALLCRLPRLCWMVWRAP
jgi:hypothetical protein